MNANKLINSSSDIQSEWLVQTKIDFATDYEYIGCFVSEEEEDRQEENVEICTCTELKCRNENIYVFFTGYSNHVDGYIDPILFGIFKNLEEGLKRLRNINSFFE